MRARETIVVVTSIVIVLAACQAAPVALPRNAPVTLAACGWPEGTPLAFAGLTELRRANLPATFGDPTSDELAYVVVTRDRIEQVPMIGHPVAGRGACVRRSDGSLVVGIVPDGWQPPG